MSNSSFTPKRFRKFVNLSERLSLKGIKVGQIGKTIILGAVVIIVFSFFWHSLISSFQKEKPLIACLHKAHATYTQQWRTTCLSLYNEPVIKRYGEDKLCESMAAEHADPIQESYYGQITECLNRFPQ